MPRRIALSMLASLMLTLIAGAALAQSPLHVRRGQFTDRVERSQPVGDAASIAATRRAVYWVEVQNPGTSTTVTVVWRLDGHESGRQTLEVGHGPRWRTWASWRLGRAHNVEVEILDAEGHSLHRDSATLATQ